MVAQMEGESVDIIGIGSHPSKGLRRGVVIDIDATVDSIRKAIEEAELMAGCEINSIYAGIAEARARASASGRARLAT